MAKKIAVFVVGVIVLVAVDILAIHYYSRYLIGYEKIYVANHNISQRNRISEDDLLMLEVPKDFVGNDVYRDKEDIIDKYVKLSYTIPKGSMFYKSAIEKNARDISNTLLFEEQVSYDVFSSEAKVNSGSLSKNMYVDFYLTISKNNKPESDLILSNARIIGLYDMNEQPILDFDKDSRVYIISFAVDKKDVNYLNMAFALGEIKIIASSDTYAIGKRSILNTDSPLFEYLK